MDQRDQDIAALVAQAQAGDAESVGQLFELLSGRIFRFLSFRTADREVAEDLTQTVFLEMIQALPRYKKQPGAKFTTWLFQLARFRLIDYYRQRRPNIPLEDAPEPSYEPLADVDPLGAAHVAQAIRRLPEKYQTVIHFRFREELPAADIARIMKTSALNVRVMQYRALRILRAELMNQLSPRLSHEHP